MHRTGRVSASATANPVVEYVNNALSHVVNYVVKWVEY